MEEIGEGAVRDEDMWVVFGIEQRRSSLSV